MRTLPFLLLSDRGNSSTKVNWFALKRDDQIVLFDACREWVEDDFGSNFALVWDLGKYVCLPHAYIYEVMEWLTDWLSWYDQPKAIHHGI